jgi:biopolymer transport protein ExbD
MHNLKQIDLDSTGSVPDINISPLIDVVFLLLIFFMVTTAFVEETGVEVQKPRATSAKQLEKKSIFIAVTPDGQVVHGGQEVGIHGIRGLVRRLIKNKPRPVILMTDEDSRAGLVVDVIDECKVAGAKTVSIATAPEEE